VPNDRGLMMLFGATAQQGILRPLAPVINERAVDPNWEETCEPGRLWLVTRVQNYETIMDLWIAYLTRGPKLICGPRSRPDEIASPAVRLLRASPVAQAHEALKNITGLDTNWAAIGSQPPNEKANRLALRVLEAIFSTRARKPNVAASAEGGVAIVYKENDKYVAIECLNRGSLWMLWFDSSGEPQSRRISTSKNGIGQAIEDVGLILQ
jgi:hypothetical protein